MKLLNINAWGGQKLPELIELLNKDAWDIITMQEVFALQTGEDEIVRRNEKVMNLIEVLRKNLRQQHFFFSSTAGYNYEEGKVEYGNLTISRFPIRNARTIFYDIDYDGDFTGTYGDYTQDPRNLQVVDIQLSNGILSVLNTHGIWQLDKKKSDTERTIEMCKTILQNTDKSTPTLVAGDFNLTPDTESINKIDSVLNNLVIQNGITNTRNKFKEVVEVVDYIFTSDLIKVNSFEVRETEASDHNAIILDFDIAK